MVLAASAASVRADIAGLKNASGVVRCQLFDREAGFPESGGLRVVLATSADGPLPSCTFEGLPAGSYAVAVLHDADGDGHMARNWLGVPLEGYGVSNDATHALSAITIPLHD